MKLYEFFGATGWGTFAYLFTPKRYLENGQEDLLFTAGDWEFGTDDAAFGVAFITALVLGALLRRRSTISAA